MPTVEVNCTVANCVFHEKGNICGANTIQVDMDYHANKTEFAAEFDTSNAKEEASHSSHTCCKTFKPKAGK